MKKQVAELQGKDHSVLVRIEERIKLTEEEGLMGKYLDSLIKHEGMFNATQAGRLAGVSSQRIEQLVKAGRLPLVSVEFDLPGRTLVLEELIPGNALRAWIEAPKSKGGRPRKHVPQSELVAA